MTNRDWLLNTTPFEVQAEALRLAEGRLGYNWFMEQGLGKTGVALADFLRLRLADLVDVLVIVCPNSLKGNWLEESDKNGAGFHCAGRLLKWFVWEGKPPKKAKDYELYDAFVFNYEAMQNAGGDVIEYILATFRCMLVMDESQRIKNPSSKTTQRLLGAYSKYAVIKRCLSGTPMTNTVMDFWPQLRMAGALNGSNPISFKNRFAVVGGFKGKQVVGVKNIEILMREVEEVSFRATKEVWAKSLPPKMYREPIVVPIPPALQEHYMTMKDEFIVMLSNEDIVAAEMVATQYNKLQQISSGFILDGKNVHRLVETHKLPKFAALIDVLDANGAMAEHFMDGGQSKTLVFAHFRETCNELVQTLAAMLPGGVNYILGGMRRDEIEHQKALFNAVGGPQVMVLQVSAGREGHTLLGGQPGNMCHTVCYYENNFNLGDRQQSEDRPHRWGQINPVLYVDFVSSPIERHVVHSLQKKKDLVAYILDKKKKGELDAIQ